MRRGLQEAAGAIGALDDDLRRRMYIFIRRQGRPTSREEAAAAAGISRKLAAFHLDKLVERGLLSAHYARAPGRSASAPGRSSKLYQPSGLEVDVSLPERRYDVVGEILVAALDQDPGESPREVAKRIAFEKGRSIGDRIRDRKHLCRPASEEALAEAENALSDFGFEPYRVGSDTLALRNCPFHALAQQSPEFVCGLNREFIDGLLRGLGNDSVEAALLPTAGECCVRLRAVGGQHV